MTENDRLTHTKKLCASCKKPLGFDKVFQEIGLIPIVTVDGAGKKVGYQMDYGSLYHKSCITSIRRRLLNKLFKRR